MKNEGIGFAIYMAGNGNPPPPPPKRKMPEPMKYPTKKK